MSTFNTPYDDVFRTLITDCKKLIIPVVNEIFHEDYDIDETITLLQNEIFMRQEDGNEEKKITDSSFEIISIDKGKRRYHIECQSVPDGSMLIRMYEYDTQLALNDSVLDQDKLTVNFPESAVLYLRHTKSTPDVMTITINVPNGSISYEVKVLKIKKYTIDEIFEKQLYFLIPFYIFVHESNLEKINDNEEKLISLQREFVNIAIRLDSETRNGKLTEYEKRTIREMTSKVVCNLAEKYDNVKKEVSEVMGGKVLDYEAKDILNQGRQEGRQEGKAETIVSAVEAAMNNLKISLEDACTALNYTVDAYNKAKSLMP